MRNIYLTNKDFSRKVFGNTKDKFLYDNNKDIYITDDSEIKKGDFCIYSTSHFVSIVKQSQDAKNTDNFKKIILTDNKYLNKKGIQTISNYFVEWLTKNPSCYFIETKLEGNSKDGFYYKIILPKEEPKQETLEEAAEIRFGTDMDSIRGGKVYDLNTDLKRGFVAGAKWQQERMYSELQVHQIIELIRITGESPEFIMKQVKKK